MRPLYLCSFNSWLGINIPDGLYFYIRLLINSNSLILVWTDEHLIAKQAKGSIQRSRYQLKVRTVKRKSRKIKKLLVNSLQIQPFKFYLICDQSVEPAKLYRREIEKIAQNVDNFEVRIMDMSLIEGDFKRIVAASKRCMYITLITCVVDITEDFSFDGALKNSNYIGVKFTLSRYQSAYFTQSVTLKHKYVISALSKEEDAKYKLQFYETDDYYVDRQQLKEWLCSYGMSHVVVRGSLLKDSSFVVQKKS